MSEPSLVFISYRRADADAEAHGLAAKLKQDFGAERVFLDVDGIGGGADFPQTIESALARTTIMLVVIGPTWLRAQDPITGKRRIDLDVDWVRRELRHAFERNIKVIPVLVRGATQPNTTWDLPADVESLTTRSAMEIRQTTPSADQQKVGQQLLDLGFVSRRARVVETLAAPSEGSGSGQDRATVPVSNVGLRADPGYQWPATPYPVLGPYTHPETFGGRQREIEALVERVCGSQLVWCLYGPSGVGKSSLLQAGLAPRLRHLGYRVSVDLHPGDPGLAERLLRRLLELPESLPLRDDDDLQWEAFATWVKHAGALAKKPPIFILDQIDGFLRGAPRERDSVLARLGPLMAATATERSDGSGYLCRWILSYRHEFHGQIEPWLRDVLLQARQTESPGLDLLPYDLGTPDRFQSWPVPVVGTPDPGWGIEDIAKTFLQAIERPLTAKINGDERRYRTTFRVRAEITPVFLAKF